MAENQEWWDRVVKNHEKANASQGDKKLWNYFLDLIRRDDFLTDIKKIRTEFNIPINGYPSKIPVNPPKLTLQEGRIVNERLEKISEKYGFHPVEWEVTMITFLLFNTAEREDVTRRQGLCVVQDVVQDKADPYSELIQSWDNTSYPIAIRISPYASENDIIDYVKRVYKTWIEPSLKLYQNPHYKIGKSRTKNDKLRERNDFIYENRDKPHKEIMKLSNAKFKDLIVDYAQVGAIISEEKKRRTGKTLKE